MSIKPMWMVRAGEGGVHVDEFRAGSFVAIGRIEMGDMSALKTRDQFTKAVEKTYPSSRKMQVATSAGQAFRFVREMKPGDRVLTYDPGRREYLVGTITANTHPRGGVSRLLAAGGDVRPRHRAFAATRCFQCAMKASVLAGGSDWAPLANGARMPSTADEVCAETRRAAARAAADFRCGLDCLSVMPAMVRRRRAK
ncbi:MAG: hypothetical protein IT520_08055 [Burkholderiales bacterium]|nr:hypothetical protein [Burkholderiales bacterium]